MAESGKRQAERQPMTADLWDRRYSKQGFAYGTDPNTFLLENISLLPTSGKTLLLGEGEGRNAVYLASRGLSVTAIDISKVGLSKARRLAEERGVKIKTVAADLAEFDFGVECWDLIVSIFCHLPFAVRAKIHQATANSLRDGGMLLIEAFSPKQLKYNTGGPPDEERLVTVELLQEDFKTLEVLLCREVERPVEEGRYHTGLSSVVQFVARRPAIQERGVVGHRERYQIRVHQAIAQSQDEDTGMRGVKDPFLSVAGHALHYTIQASREMGQCPYCHSKDLGADRSRCCRADMLAAPKQEDCVCMETAHPKELTCGKLHWALLCHPLEFMRSSSSGKLVASLLGGEFLVFGVRSHQEVLDTILADSSTQLLLPGDGSRTLKEWLAEQVEMPFSGRGIPDLTLLVLDGSWDQVHALRAEIEVRRHAMGRPPLSCIRLDDSVQHFRSPLIDALKPGAGQGRVSTFEACALFLREAEDGLAIPPGTWKEAMRGLEPMLRVLQRCFALPTESQERVPDLELLIACLQAVACDAPLQDGLRRCSICGAAFATPLRMRDHLRGRRHCAAVAVRFARDRGLAGPVVCAGSEAAQIFQAYSTVPLSQCRPEPPDVALVQLKNHGFLRKPRELRK
ncbi:unnamed protein product, partial [Durusdinium trenchii]